MSPNGYASNVKIHCHVRKPMRLRCWIYSVCKALGVVLPVEFLIRMEVKP